MQKTRLVDFCLVGTVKKAPPAAIRWAKLSDNQRLWQAGSRGTSGDLRKKLI